MYCCCITMKTYPVRYPEDHIQKMQDIARNQHKKTADVFREAVKQYLGGYSTIPSLKEVDRAVQTLQREMGEIKKALCKRDILK